MFIKKLTYTGNISLLSPKGIGMKKQYIIYSIFIFSYFFLITQAHDERIHTAHSFLFYRPVYYNINARSSIWSHLLQQEDNNCSLGAQAYFIYQRSQHTSNIARYFLLNCKDHILFAGDQSPQKKYRDVRAEWFNLPSDFSGYLSLSPYQKQYAFVFNYSQDLFQVSPWEILQPCWLELSIPIQHVENSLNPNQFFPEGNEIINAFEQPGICSAKLYTNTQQLTDIAEIKLTLGYRWLVLDGFLLSTYSSVIIPTGGKHNPEYLFSPYTGPDGFFGVGTGVRLEMPLFDTPLLDNPQIYSDSLCDIKTYFFFDIENQYFLASDRIRTFDLRNKPWSKYLQYRRPYEQETISGTKILTLHTWVEPHNMIDLTTGFLASWGHFHTEWGYSLWARQKETLYLIRPACQTQSFKFACYGIAGSEHGTSASTSTICARGPNDPVFALIRASEIDLCSAAYSGGSAHRVHGFVGYRSHTALREYFGGVGLFYEFYEVNSALNNAGLWIKLGSNF